MVVRITKISLFLFVFFLVMCYASYARAGGPWGMNQDWSSYSEGTAYTSGTSLYVTGGRWYFSGGYSSQVAQIDNAYYDSSTSDTNSMHVGYPSAGSTSTCTHYLYYYFDNALPSEATLRFYWSASYAYAYVYTGSSSYYFTNYSYITSYDNWYSVTLPAGATYFRFYIRTYRDSNYGMWLDSISVTLKDPVYMTDITGYNKEGLNFGVLNLTAAYDYDSFLGSVTLDSLEWQYRYSTDVPDVWTDAPSYYDGTNFYTTIDVTGVNDLGFSVRARTDYKGTYSGWLAKTIPLSDFDYTGIELSGSPPGGVIDIKANLEIVKFEGVYLPPNPWTYYSYYSYYYYNNLLHYDPLPIGGKILELETNFAYVPSSSSYFYFSIWKKVSGSTFTEVKESSSYSAYTGVQQYTLNWDIEPGMYIGYYCYRCSTYYNSGAPYRGNEPITYYWYPTSSNLTGTYTWPTTGSYAPVANMFELPTRVKMDGSGLQPADAQFRYHVGAQELPVDIDDSYADVDGNWHVDWESWAIDSDDVYIDVRFEVNGAWQQWFTEGPFTVRNRIILSFQTQLGADVPGSGSLTVNGEDYPSGSNVEFLYYKQIEIIAPTYVFDGNGKRWRYDAWSDGGAQTHNISTTPGMTELVYTANFLRQMEFIIESLRPDHTGSAPGWYEPNTELKRFITRYSIEVEEEWRFECKGYQVYYNDSSVPAYTSTMLEFIEKITKDTRIVILWQEQFMFVVKDDRNTGTGNLPGWYNAGAQIDYSVFQYLNNGDNARLRCTGYLIGQNFYPDVTEIHTAISQPMIIDWEWIQQFYVIANTNIGTITPEGIWGDVGSELTIIADSGTEDLARFTFQEWKGTGSGVVREVGGEPVAVVTIGSPIVQQAVWKIEYNLILSSNGTFSPDVNGWYLPGQDVAVNAVSPAYSDGQRWLPLWTSSYADGVNEGPQDDTPVSVTITMNKGVRQDVSWQEQFRLIISNPSDIGQVFPDVGTYWFFTDTVLKGFATYSLEHSVCSGYTGTGSYQSSDHPRFRGPITSASTVSWNFRDRVNQPTFGLDDPALLPAMGPVAFSRTSTGAVTLAYVTTAGELVYAIWSGTAWQPTSVATGLPEITSIDLDSSGTNPSIVCHTTENNLFAAYFYYVPNFAPEPAGGFDELINDDPQYGGINSHVAVDLQGNSWVSSFLAAGGLMLSRIDSFGNSESILVDGEGTPGFYNDIAIDPVTDMPVIVYYDAFTRMLKLARFVGEGFSITTIDDNGNVGIGCCMLIDDGGVIHIVYRDVTRADKTSVKYAKIIGDQISLYFLDKDNNPGDGLSFAMGEEGCPYMTYYSSNSLRLTRFNGVGWEIYTVVKGITPGRLSAVTTLPDGRPLFAYKTDNATYFVAAPAGNLQPDNVTGGTPGYIDVQTGGGGGGCFIATAAFGTMTSNTVSTLCSFRDTSLDSSVNGTALTSLYYSVSPQLAERTPASVRSLLRILLSR